MSTANALTMTQIALQLATQLQQVIASQAQARAEGREVNDEEVTRAADGAQQAIEALKAMRGSPEQPPQPPK